MRNEHLKTLRNEWKGRIAASGLTIKVFCERYQINYHTFNNMRNPSVYLVDYIERKLTELESK